VEKNFESYFLIQYKKTVNMELTMYQSPILKETSNFVTYIMGQILSVDLQSLDINLNSTFLVVAVIKYHHHHVLTNSEESKSVKTRATEKAHDVAWRRR
jgi:hypothetical protein